MPIGKNSIKRVENNGYSNVKSEAPDMDNSHVMPDIEEKKKETKPVAKHLSRPSTRKPTPVSSVKVQGHECEYIAIGEEMPIYLL